MPVDRAFAQQFAGRLVVTQTAPPGTIVTEEPTGNAVALDDWRAQITQRRCDSIDQPGIYLDRSVTGAGKSHADIQALQAATQWQASRGLVVVPTHENCRELVHDMQRQDLSASAYPARVVGEEHEANCWNPEADEAETMGLTVMKTICPHCRKLDACRKFGYIGELRETARADVVVATHARARGMGLLELGRNRAYWAVHEDAVNILRPSASMTEADLLQAQLVLRQLLNDPRWLNRFGNGKTDKDREQRDAQYAFIRHLADVADHLAGEMKKPHAGNAPKTTEIRSGGIERRPAGIERVLFLASRETQCRFSGQPWKPLIAFATGELHQLALIVEDRFAKSGTVETRRLLAVWKNRLPLDTTVWFCDATANAERLASLAGLPVQDRTPRGHIMQKHRSVQIPHDITRSTTEASFQNTLRGVIAHFADRQRIGVICHRPHVPYVESLEPLFAGRITKVSYYGSGAERASNDWYRQCDLIVVAGTPRVPPSVVRGFMAIVGESQDAALDGGWTTKRWKAKTESGQDRDVQASGYTNEKWDAAYKEIVRSALVQAIGRGRGVMGEGCDVVVLSNQECGLPVMDDPVGEISRIEATILEQLLDYSANDPAFDESVGIRVDRIRQDVAPDLSDRQMRRHLVVLEHFGLARRVGKRSGWNVGDALKSLGTLPRHRAEQNNGHFPDNGHRP